MATLRLMLRVLKLTPLHLAHRLVVKLSPNKKPIIGAALWLMSSSLCPSEKLDANAVPEKQRWMRLLITRRGRGHVRACHGLEKGADAAVFPASTRLNSFISQLRIPLVACSMANLDTYHLSSFDNKIWRHF